LISNAVKREKSIKRIKNVFFPSEVQSNIQYKKEKRKKQYFIVLDSPI